MPAKRRRGKAAAEEVADPGARQRCRMPDWWDRYSEADLRAMQARGRQLVAGEPIGWD